MPVFEEKLSQTTCEIFTNIFGQELSASILENIKEHSINGISEFFTETLPHILDATGSMILGDLVLDTLYGSVGIELKRIKSNTFKDYLLLLKQKLESERHEG